MEHSIVHEHNQPAGIFSGYNVALFHSSVKYRAETNLLSFLRPEEFGNLKHGIQLN